MADTIKDLTSNDQLVSQSALEKALSALKVYIDQQDNKSYSEEIVALRDRLETLIGLPEGDANTIIDTFNEVKAFLRNYTEGSTLQEYLSGINNSIINEENRAKAVEQSIINYMNSLGVNVMTSQQAKALYDSVFNPIENE